MLQRTTKLFLTTVAAIATINTIETPQIPNTSNSWLTIETKAQARSSGGRSGGGSFSRGSNGSRSSGRSFSRSSSSSSGSRSRGRSSTRSRSYNSSPNYSSSTTYYSSGGGYSDGGRGVSVLFFGITVIVIFAIVSSILKAILGSNNNENASGNYNREIDNDIVTISQLQIALLASATDVQTGLSELSFKSRYKYRRRIKRIITRIDFNLTEKL